MKLNSILTDHFCTYYKVDMAQEYKIERVDAGALIVPERIDLIAKLKYIEYREKGYDLTFIKDLYTAHIEAFSNGSFIEPGNESKNSINKYFETFDSLIENIRQNGIDENISVIPVGNNDAFMDGAHRVAIAAYFKLKVPIIRFNHINVNFDVNFFKERLLEKKYIDFLVTEYCKYKKNIYCACVWPRAKGELKKKEMNTFINQACKIVYEKKVNLNYFGLRNFIVQIYGHQSWVGSADNHYAGVTPKVDECFEKDRPLTVYVLECDSFEKILKLKEDIRRIFNLENHSIHITDNHPEALQIANLLLNENSVEFLNRGKPDSFLKFNEKLDIFKKQLIQHDLLFEHFIIDSSSTLGLYGLRDVGDIDFMTISQGYEVIENGFIENNHQYINLYGTTIEDMVINPENYFVYNDLKFVTLNLLKKFKTNRNKQKDQDDIVLIDSILKEKQNLHFLFINIKTKFKRKSRNLKFFIKSFLIRALKKLGLYGTIKRMVKGIKSEC